MGLRKNDLSNVSNTICGFDKNHFSKPVLLSYAKGYIQHRELIAVLQIEDSIIEIESSGLKAKSGMHNTLLFKPAKKIPEIYSKFVVQKFNQWIDTLTVHTIIAGAILDILIDGKTFVYVDRRFRKTNGWARSNLIKGLQLWDIAN